MEQSAILEGRGLTKRFGGVTALDSVDVRLTAGKITALLGENGAGKSTLVACMSGSHRPDSGTLHFSGKETRLLTPDDARRTGIAVIHQEPQMLEEQSVASNIYLPRLASGVSTRYAARALEAMAAEHLAILQIHGLEPARPMHSLNGAQRQLVEIARALIGEPKVLFLDEPNASLGEAESERLFTVIRQLRDRGVAVILVSHRLREVYELAEHIVIMRDGKKVADGAVADLPVNEAIHFITGGSRAQPVAGTSLATAAPRPHHDVPLLSLTDLTGPGFANVSFDLRSGEILGMSGLVGSGRTELAQAVIGASHHRGGALRFREQQVRFADPSEALRQGIAYVPEGRRDAVFYGRSVDFNIRAGMWGRLGRNKSRLGNAEAARRVASLIDKLSVKTDGPQANASTLSGGNQQKLLFARALSADPALLILDEPTHGVDVGAKREIHDLIRALAAEGMAIWFISSEVEEVVELASRIVVIHQGRVAGELPGGSAIEDVLARNFGETGNVHEQRHA